MTKWTFLLCCCLPVSSAVAANPASDWPQGPGPNGDFQTKPSSAPSEWSVTRDNNIVWRVELPETGQSTPVVAGDRIFLSTMKPVEADADTGSDIVAHCYSAIDGTLLWSHAVPGKYQTRLSAPFGDASSPAAVTDGKHVWFLNPAGRMVCFTVDGNAVWDRPLTSASRTRPVLHNGMLIVHRQVYLPDESGRFGHENAHADHSKWTQLQAIDAKTGRQVWLSDCGVNMGCVPILQRMNDSTPVMIVGRGGGHGPPETPEGISMIHADTGETIWTLALPQYMSTQMYPIVDDQALIFHKTDHLWVDAQTGQISRRASIVKDVSIQRHSKAGYSTVTDSLAAKKPRSITQQSNLRVGDYHYFRSYTQNYLGRIHIGTGHVEYLELPLQIDRISGQPDRVLWPSEKAGDAKRRLAAVIRPNSVRNSRGFRVMGDARAEQNGWGHTAAPLATAFGDRLLIPLLSGMVFVIDASASVLNEDAVIAVNDLGPLGDSFTRSSITTDGRRAYARTIRELIAIESP